MRKGMPSNRADILDIVAGGDPFGDFSRYTSKPLRDFIYESNNGSHIFFVSTEDDAIEKLAGAEE